MRNALPPLDGDRPPSARQRILDVACRLFYQDGVRATGIDRIIADSAVAKMSFYRNFKSKADLVAAYLALRHDRWLAWFTQAVEEKVAQGGCGLEVIADVLQLWFQQPDFRGCAFINAVAESGATDGEDARISRQHKRDLRDYLAGLAGRLSFPAPDAVAEAVLIVIEGTIVRAQMQAGDAAIAAARDLLRVIR
ncbi:MAG TPA: TetR/AcrR family transcriptional regulator [Telmatospirillum sp.]|nr:TetR/AcrR family transcriptional regulator [Telmatospirillum sp.]